MPEYQLDLTRLTARQQSFWDRMSPLTKSFITAAFWAGLSGEKDEATKGLADLDQRSLAYMVSDAVTFAIRARPILELMPGDRVQERAGVDFYLTRNGHGAGFWDGDWPEPFGTQLTTLAKGFGEFDLYVGDDGKVYRSDV